MSDMVDTLSVAAGIIAVLQLTAALISYLGDIKDALKDCACFAIEALRTTVSHA